MSRPLQAAVIGLGVGEQHARALAGHPGSRLRWVYDLDALRMRRVIGAIGQGDAAENLSAVLADPAVDVVSIATYDAEHAGQVVAALDAGKHVFCEKPLAHSLDEIAAIRGALSRQPDRHLACNLVLRAAPLYVWLRAAIARGDLGEIYAFDGDYLYGRIEKITQGWRGQAEGYSVMQGGGVHLVDLMLWLTGQRPTDVTAVGNRIATQGTDFRYDDFVAATYRFEKGLVGRITANFGCVHRHQHVVRVFGTKATFLYDDRGARLHSSRDPDAQPELLAHAPLPAGKGDLIPDFIEAIRTGRDREAQIRHELAVISACVAADRALASGENARIEYP
ncbi:MAG: Gfo/Idh/MocA family protein [Polyangia bacterium]